MITSDCWLFYILINLIVVDNHKSIYQLISFHLIACCCCCFCMCVCVCCELRREKFYRWNISYESIILISPFGLLTFSTAIKQNPESNITWRNALYWWTGIFSDLKKIYHRFQSHNYHPSERLDCYPSNSIKHIDIDPEQLITINITRLREMLIVDECCDYNCSSFFCFTIKSRKGNQLQWLKGILWFPFRGY